MSQVNDTPERMNYETIKALAAGEGAKVTDLLALAPQNDPFYVGTPTTLAMGQWFADVWQQAGYTSGVHLRRVHYWLVSQDPPYPTHKGELYTNTDNHWKYLGNASKYARYLDLVRIADVIDRKNPDPHVFADYPYTTSPEYYVSTPELDAPGVGIYGIDNALAQPYHLEVWCEKSTMDDVLLPVAQRYGANLVTFEGEVSITSCCHDLVKRIDDSGGKPCRIWYLSDFDPAGKSIPAAMSRKVEWALYDGDLDYDVKITPLALTPEQVQRYRLPRTPIKKTEKRAEKFEDAFGAGATELDALEAIHPGELADLVDGALSPYYSEAAAREVRERTRDLHQAISAQVDAITARYAAEIEALADMITELRAVEVDAAEYAVDRYSPHVIDGNDWLFDSQRDYLTQIAYYKAHKSGDENNE